MENYLIKETELELDKHSAYMLKIKGDKGDYLAEVISIKEQFFENPLYCQGCFVCHKEPGTCTAMWKEYRYKIGKLYQYKDIVKTMSTKVGLICIPRRELVIFDEITDISIINRIKGSLE